MEKPSTTEALEEQPDLLEAFAEQQITIFGQTGTFRDLAGMCPVDLSDPRVTLGAKNEFVVKVANEAGLEIDSRYEAVFSKIVEDHDMGRKFTVAEPKPEQQTVQKKETQPKTTDATSEIVVKQADMSYEAAEQAQSPVVTDVEPTAAELEQQLDYSPEVSAAAERSARQAVEEAFAREFVQSEVAPDTHRSIEAARIVPGAPSSAAKPDAAAVSEQHQTVTAEATTWQLQLVRAESADTLGSADQDLTAEPSLILFNDGGAENAFTVVDEDIEQVVSPELSRIGIEPTGESEVAQVELGAANVADTVEAVQVIDIETLLRPPEPFEAVIESESTLEVPEPEQASKPAVFTEQIALLVEQTVAPERQPAMAAMLERMYDIIDAETDVTVVQTDEVEDDIETEVSKPEMTEELQAIVTILLQELGVAEPTTEQIERFVGLVRAERLGANTSGAAQAVPEPAAKERLYDSTATVWQRYQTFWRLHQPLGELALTVPAAS